MSARPSQYPWTLAEFGALPAKVDLPTAASILGTGPKNLREQFNGGRTARVQVGDQEVVIRAIKLGRQTWVITESLRPVFEARGP